MFKTGILGGFLNDFEDKCQRGVPQTWNLGAIIGISICLPARLIAVYSISCRNSGMVRISLMTDFGHKLHEGHKEKVTPFLSW